MSAPLQPSFRFTLRLEKAPASAGTTVYRWSTKPLGDEGAWAEGRLVSISVSERKLSTPEGDHDIPWVDLVLDDTDGLFRGLVADPETQTFTAREGALELLSSAGRAAGLEWRPILRGRISDIQLLIGRQARLRLTDELGSYYSGFDLERTLGVPISLAEHPNADPDVINGRIYPIVIGEHSDVGAVDENGEPADKGLLPVIDCGDYPIGSDGAVVEDTSVSYLPAPTGLAATVNGTPGSAPLVYEVTALSTLGETIGGGSIEILNGPDALNGTDNVTLEWAPVAGAAAYRVYKWGHRIITLDNGGTFVDPETTWTDDGSRQQDVPLIHIPETNTAAVDQTINGDTVGGWGRLVQKIGASAETQHVYASDLAPNDTPRRIRMPESVYGSEFLVYGRPGWPHAEPYIEINGIRMGVIYARGPRLEQHRKGTVTITWNGCGDDEVGDGSGPTIDEAFKCHQHVLNEYVLKDGGVGYRTGNFGPLEEYSNGVAKLKTSAFEACQALTVDWVGGRGYLAAFAIVEPISLGEFLKRFLVTFAANDGANHHGQYYPVLIDDTADPDVGRMYRDRIEVIRPVSQELRHELVETRVRYVFDYDTEAQRFRVAERVIEDVVASAAHKGARQRGVRQCFYTRDEPTAADANARHLARYKRAPHYFGIETDLTGLEDELGAQVRVQHYEDLSLGEYAVPYLVKGHQPDPMAETTRLVGFDLGRILASGFPLLEDELTMDGNLGDELSAEDPPVGAFELR